MNYQTYPEIPFGGSDIAHLVVLGLQHHTLVTNPISMGTNGNYRGYLADQNLDTENLVLVHEYNHWVKIYDDTQLIFSSWNDHHRHIRIYMVQTLKGKGELILQFLK